jgi:tyrosyl-tRNA synthetase
MEAKKRLAWEIVSMFDGDEAADRAAAHFERVHQQRALPEEIPTHALAGPVCVVDVIFAAGFARSKSDARRLVQQGAVKLDGQPVSNVEAQVEAGAERVLQVGKRFFLRLTPENKTA